jgi:seryl-tRNA synthetase
MFADGYLTDVLRNMGNDPIIDQKVKRKLVRILAAWHAQYKNDPSMKTAANLYKQHKSDAHSTWRPEGQTPKDEELEAAKRKNKEEARRKAKEEAEREAAEKKKKRESARKPKPKRKPFNFEEVL